MQEKAEPRGRRRHVVEDELQAWHEPLSPLVRRPARRRSPSADTYYDYEPLSPDRYPDPRVVYVERRQARYLSPVRDRRNTKPPADFFADDEAEDYYHNEKFRPEGHTRSRRSDYEPTRRRQQDDGRKESPKSDDSSRSTESRQRRRYERSHPTEFGSPQSLGSRLPHHMQPAAKDGVVLVTDRYVYRPRNETTRREPRRRIEVYNRGADRSGRDSFGSQQNGNFPRYNHEEWQEQRPTRGRSQVRRRVHVDDLHDHDMQEALESRSSKGSNDYLGQGKCL